MAYGKKNEYKLDPLTTWELAAINLLIALNPESGVDVKASKENMLSLMQALDRGELEPALADPGFMNKTEALLLVLLRGERVEVSDATTFAAQKEIFAAAQVIYNQAIAKGLWKRHPEIRKAMDGN